MIATPEHLRREDIAYFFAEGVRAYTESRRQHRRLSADSKRTMYESYKLLLNLKAPHHAEALMRLALRDLTLDEYAAWRNLTIPQFLVPHSEFRIPNSEFRIPDSAFRIPN